MRATSASCLGPLLAPALLLLALLAPAAEARALKQATTWWKGPPLGAASQYMLDEATMANWPKILIPGVTVYYVDLFTTTKEQVRFILDKGFHPIAYFSAGTYETWRPDARNFTNSAIGKEDPDWPNEFWLDIRNPTIRPIMEARIALAAAKGFKAVDPDNVDVYHVDPSVSGFSGISYDDQLVYNRWLAATAHAYGLGIGLKNDLNQVNDLVNDFDFATNEHCGYYKECNLYKPFLDAQKFVLDIEYKGETTITKFTSKICPQNTAMNISSILKDWALAWRGYRLACRGRA